MADKRVTRSKKIIKSAFLELFMSKDFDKITVAEVSRKADIHRKTFYSHYNSLDELLSEFEDDIFDSVSDELAIRVTDDVNLIADVFVDKFIENKDWLERISLTGRNEFFLTRCRELIVDLLISQINVSISNDDGLYFKLIYIASGLLSICMEWLKDNKETDIEQLKMIGERIIEENMKTII